MPFGQTYHEEAYACAQGFGVDGTVDADHAAQTTQEEAHAQHDARREGGTDNQ